MSPGRRCAQTRPSMRPSDGRGSACRSVRVASSGENWCCPTISLVGSSVGSDHRKADLGQRTRLEKHVDVVEVGYVTENNEPMVIKVSTVTGADNKAQLQVKGKKVDESDQESARESTGSGSTDQYETYDIDENTEYSSAEEEEEIRERKGYKKEVEGTEGSPAKKRRPDQKQVNKFSVIDPRRQASQEEEEHRNCCDNSEVGGDSSSSGNLVQEAAYSRPRDKITTSYSQPITKGKSDFVATRHSRSLPLPNWLLRRKPSRKFKRANPNCERYRSSEVMPRCRSRDRTKCCRCSSKEDEDEDDEDDDSSRPEKCGPGCKKALPVGISLQPSPHRRSHGKKYSDRNNAKFSKALTPIDPFNTNFFFGHTIDETILEMMHTLSLLKYNGSTDQKKPNLSLCPAKQSHISSALTGNLMVQQSTFLRNALGTTVDEVLLSSYSRIRTMFQSKESKNEQEEHERSLRAEESELGLSSCTEETTYKPTPDLDKLSGLAIDDTVDVVNWLRDEYVALAEDEKLAKRHKKPSPGPLSPESLRQRRYVLDCLTQVMRKKKEMEDRKKDKQKTRTSDQRKRKGAAMITMAPNNCPCASPSPCEHGTIPALLVQATPSEVARIKKLAQQSDGTTMFQPQNFSPTFADPARILNPAEEMPSLPHPEGIKTCEYVSMETKETNDDGPIVQELHFNKNAHFDSGQSDSLTYNSGYSFMTHGSRRHTVSTSYDSTISISNSSSTQCSRCFGSYQYGNRTESCLSCISVSTGRKHRRKARPFTPTQYTKTTEYQYSPSQSSDSEMPSSYEPDMRYVENQTSSDSTSDFSEISRCEWNKRRRERLSRNAPCLRKNSEKKLSDKHLLCTYMTDKPFESSLEQLNFISSFTDSPDKFEEHSPNTQSFADGSTTEDGESPPISPSQVPLKHLSESNEKSEGLITKPRDCVIKPPDCVFKTPDCVIPRPGDAVNVMNICNEGNAMNNCNEGNQTCYKNTSEKTENQKSHRRCRWTNFSSSPKAEITANSGTLPNGREVGCVSGSLRHRLMEEVKSRVLMAKSISHTSQKQESNKDRLPEKCNETPNSTIPVNNGLKIMPGPSDLNSNMNYCPPREPENKESSCRPETKSNTRERNGETLATVPRDIVEELEIYFQRNNNAYGMSRSQENRPYTKDQNKAFSPKFVRKIPHRPEFQPHHQIRNDRASSNVHRQGEITCKSSYPQSRIESPKCRPLDENCKEFLSHPILKDRLTPNMYGQQDETTNHPYPQSKVRAQCMKFCEKMENHKMYSPNPETKDTSPNNHKLKKETPTCCEPTTQTIEKTPRIHEEIKTHKQCFPLRVFKERISPLIHKKQDEMPKCSCTKLQIRDPSPNCCEEVVSGEHTSPSRVMKCRISPNVNQQEELISKPPHAVTEEREHTQKCHEKTEYQRQMPQCREQMSKPPHTEEREQAQKCHEKTEYQRQMPQCREQMSKPPHTEEREQAQKCHEKTEYQRQMPQCREQILKPPHTEEREQAQKCHEKTEYQRQMPQCREQVSKPPHTAIEEREQAQKCHDKTEYHRQMPQCREQVSKPPHTAIEEREQAQKCHDKTEYHRQMPQCREQVSKPPHTAIEEREQAQKCHDKTEYHRQMPQCREQVSKPPHTVVEEREQAQKCHDKTEYHRQLPQCREQVSKPPHTAIEEREQTQKCHEETQYHRQTAQCREQVSKPPHSASEEREQTQKCHEGTEYHRQMSQCREQVSKPPQAVIEEKEQAQKCHEKTEYHRQMPQCRVLKDELSPNREEYLTQGEIQTVNSSSHSAGKCCSPQHQTCENGCCNPNEGNEHHQDHPPRSKLENRPLLLPPRYEQECQKQCSQLKCHVRNPSSLSITSSDHRRVNNRPRSVKSVVRSIEEWSSQDSTSYDFSARSRRTSSKASNDGQSCIKLRLENTTSLSEELCSNATTTDASNDTSNDTLNNTRQHCSEIKLEPLEHDEESYIVPKSCVSPMNAPEVPDSSSVHFVSLTRNAVVDLSEALLAPQEAEIKCSETERLEKLENTNEVPKAPTKGTAEGDGLNQGRHTLNPDQELIMNLPLSPIRISQTQSDTQASVRFGQDVKERRPRQHAYTLVDNIANRRLKKDKRTVERDSNFTPETKNTIPNLNSGQGKSEPSVEDLVAAIYRANVFYASHNMERTWNNFTKSEITPPCLDKVAPPQRTHSNNSETKGKEIDEMREEQKDQNVENKPPDVISKEDEKVQNIENKPSEVKPTKENKNVPKASSDEKVKRKEVKKTPKNDELHSTKSQTNLHSRKTKEAREIRKKRSATKVGDKNKPSHKGVFVTYANKEGWQSTSKRSLVATAPNSNESHGSKPHEKRHRERNVRLHEHVSDKRLLIKPNATQSKPMRLFSYLTSRRQNEELCREHRMLKVMHMSAHTRYGARMHHSSVVRYPPMEKESLISPVVSKDLRRERYKMHDERALIPKRENNISSPLARRLNNHIQNLSARYRKSVAGEKVRGRHSYPEGTVSIPPPENIRKIHSSPEENRIMTGELRKRRNNASLDRSSRRFNPRSRDGSKSSARMSLMQIAKNPPFGLHRRLPVQNQISATFQIPQDSPQDSDETQKRRKRRSKQKVGNESSSKDVNKPEKMEDKTTETELRGKKKTKPSGGPQKQVAAKASPTKVLWAITRINIFEDNSRTYEVMKPTYKTPKKIPSTTEGLFALTPQ